MTRPLPGIIKKYGLDQPLYEQYWRWLVGVTDPTTGKRRGRHPVRGFWLFAHGFPTCVELI